MTCDVTGLTDAEKSSITNSWKILNEKKKDSGVALFVTLFSAYPDTVNYFHDFEGKSVDELKKTADLRAHATAVMYAMGSIVDNLNDPQCMLGLIKKISRNHKARKIGRAEFENLRGLFGRYLDATLGSESSDTVKAAWDKFLEVMNTQIEKDQKEL